MDSIFPLIASSLIGVVVLVFFYFLFYLSNKKRFFALWTVAWGIYAIRLFCVLLPILSVNSNLFISISNQILNIISTTLILYGSYLFLNKKLSSLWIILCSAMSLYLILSNIITNSVSTIWLFFPASVLAGWIHLRNGFLFTYRRANKTKYSLILMLTFLLWGIHTIHYSIYMAYLPSSMLLFYLIDITLTIIISIGLLFEYFEDAQNRLKFSEENYNLFLDNTEEAIVIARDGKILFNNSRAEKISGYDKDELLGKSFVDLLYYEDRDEVLNKHPKHQQGDETSKYFVFRIICKSGEIKWLEGNSTTFLMNGKVTTVNFLRDITDKKIAEEELGESKRHLFTLMSNLPGMAYRSKNNPGRTMEFVSGGSLPLTGYKPEEIISNKLSYASIIHPEDRKRILNHIQSAFSENKPFEVIYRINCATGKEKWVLEKGQMVLDEGNIVAIEGFITDITERRNTEIALMQSLLKYEKTFHAMPVWIAITTLHEGRYIEVNETFLKDTGYKQNEVIGKTWVEVETWVDTKIKEQMRLQVKETGKINNMEVQRKNKKGEIINALFSAELLTLDEQEVIISVTQNITVLKQIQEDRDILNEQLLHSQKMESIGRLAGGVAHDFNNMLTVIMGNAEILKMKSEEDSFYQKSSHEILNAAERSANITKQLLAFARKQTIEPRVLDINIALDGMLKMLKRLIGEDIELIWKPKNGLWSVKIDPSQIDQIIVNLCVNSRDAIEYNGKILIETNNVVIDKDYSDKNNGLKPGEYVLITFSDNGKGIDKDIIENIFEPFFTTKEVGKGTGLGLSTVYGIVKQNNGFIEVNSVVGKGTEFKIYVPRYKIEGKIEKVENRANPIEAQGETILVVEDDISVREVIIMILESLGYNVLSSGSPKEAIKIVNATIDEIHLLLSDVVMPDMSGRDMAKKITKIRPDIKVLFMSGYTSDSVVHEGVLYEGLNFIKKPFTVEKLGLKVREVLNKI